MLRKPSIRQPGEKAWKPYHMPATCDLGCHILFDPDRHSRKHAQIDFPVNPGW
jgi:hypothetical protein